MSLTKQLWLAILVIISMAFGGGFLVSVLSGKNYLEQQLQLKNIDNASSLALSISQMEKNPVNIELMLSAQFDNGHYQYISLIDPMGNVITERKGDLLNIDAPAWFVKLFHIDTKPGIAKIHDGWVQYAVLHVQSDPSFAYSQLWRSTLLMFLGSVLMGVVSCYLGALALRAIMRPLDDVVKQAKAIGERHFIHMAEPKIVEFRLLVSAMNQLSSLVGGMVEQQSQHLEQLRLETNYDAVTGLMNRGHFLTRVNLHRSNEEEFSQGVLVIAHISNLAAIDKMLGHMQTDQLLHQLGQALESLTEQNPAWMTGRIRGADLAVFCTEATDSFAMCSQIRSALNKAAGIQQMPIEFQLSIAASSINKLDSLDSLESMMSQTLHDPAQNGDAPYMMGTQQDVTQQGNAERQWRTSLTTALDAGRIKLASFPVVDNQGSMIHRECPVRLQLTVNGDWLPAGEFISWANRLGMVSRIDKLMVAKALDELQSSRDNIGLNLSSSAIADPDCVTRIAALVRQHPHAAARLWLEVPEQGAFQHLAEFRALCAQLKPLGCKLGIEHVGTHVSRLGELHDLGLDYIKIDSSIIRGIDKDSGNQAFLKGLCLIAHSIGMLALAEGVQTAEEIACLPTLGIDGMTGPGVTQAWQQKS